MLSFTFNQRHRVDAWSANKRRGEDIKEEEGKMVFFPLTTLLDVLEIKTTFSLPQNEAGKL